MKRIFQTNDILNKFFIGISEVDGQLGHLIICVAKLCWNLQLAYMAWEQLEKILLRNYSRSNLIEFYTTIEDRSKTKASAILFPTKNFGCYIGLVEKFVVFSGGNLNEVNAVKRWLLGYFSAQNQNLRLFLLSDERMCLKNGIFNWSFLTTFHIL